MSPIVCIGLSSISKAAPLEVFGPSSALTSLAFACYANQQNMATMIRSKAPKLLIPRSLAMYVHDASAPCKWNLRPSFNPLVRSPNQMLRCLDAEIATDSKGALVIILGVKYYEANPSPKSCVKLLLGDIGVTTRVQFADCGDGTTNVWATVPSAALKEGLTVTLQVISDDLLRDQLEIGVIQAESAQNAAPQSRKKIPPIPNRPKSVLRAPNPSAAATSKDESKDELNASAQDCTHPRDTLPPDYERLCLRVEGDLDSAMKAWTALEHKVGRRLVRFWREQSSSLVKIRFAKYSPLDPYNENVHMVISCISLPDHEGLWVTSFDIVRLAEYILHLPLNTDMKNRARRNMSSVECKTLLRVVAHEGAQKEAFTTIMKFGNPKPRSIEASIKVYQWKFLQTCLAKILQRFIIYLPGARTGPVGFEHQLEAVNRWKRRRRGNASIRGPAKTRRDANTPTFIDEDDPKSKMRIRRSQGSKKPIKKASTMYGAATNPHTPLEQEELRPTLGSPKEEYKTELNLNDDKNNVFSNHSIDQPVPVQTTSIPLVVTPLAVDPTPAMLSLASSIDSGQQNPIHPSLQSGSSSSLTIVHQGWPVPSHEASIPNTIICSPMKAMESSFALHSPSNSTSSSPGLFYLVDANAASHQEYSVLGSSSGGYSPQSFHSATASSSVAFTPTWSSHPHHGHYVHTLIVHRSSDTLVDQGPNFGFHHYSHLGTPVTSSHVPVLVRGIGVHPYCPLYDIEQRHTLHMQGLSQASFAAHPAKEEERDVDTNEWLDNEYIMSQENKYVG